MTATPALVSKQLGYLQSKHTGSWGDAALNTLQRGNYSNQFLWSKRPGLLLGVYHRTQKGSPQPTQTSQQKNPTQPPNPLISHQYVTNFRESVGSKALLRLSDQWTTSELPFSLGKGTVEGAAFSYDTATPCRIPLAKEKRAPTFLSA